MHVPFAHWLVSLHQPRSIVELGTHKGVSYSAFCEAVQRAKIECRCFAVDTWQGDEHAGLYGAEVYEELRSFHDSRYAAFSELVRSTFDAALQYIPDDSVDLLHIDGLHTYEAVRHDFEQWKCKLTDRAVVLFHDTNVREREFGVWRLWKELSHQYPAFEFLHGHGLGVLVVGGSCGEAVSGLTRLSASASNSIRERFAFLGSRWHNDMQAHLDRAEFSERIRHFEAQWRDRAARVEALDAEVARLQECLAQAGSRSEPASTAEEHEAEYGRLQAEVEWMQAELSRVHAETALQARQTASHRLSANEAMEARKLSEQALADARRQVKEVGDRLADATAMLTTIQASTAWRATWPVRQFGKHLPRPIRRAIGGSARLAWWTVTLQLRQKLLRRRARPSPIASEMPERALPDDRLQRLQPVPRGILPRTDPVDIIICVHNALESVQACIESVLRCTLPPYRVIIIDDCSDASTAAFLAQQAREQGFLLHRNRVATGYTLAANTGLRLAKAPWVVLLNSDAIVTSKWLDRMWTHGARNSSIGVVGPLSNTASWQSVPSVFDGDDWASNPLPPAMSIEEMGDLVASQGIGATPLPFINGFCYMIRGTLLRSVGLFDEVTFGAGYGEENDYSIRVRKAGWSLVAATDTYVYHAQSMSYSLENRLRLVKNADRALAQKHDPARDIAPQARFCRDSLAMASSRARIEAGLQRRKLVDQGRRSFEGRRIAFILPISERGGGGNVVLQESMALQRMGVDVTLLNLEHYQRALGPIPELETLLVHSFLSVDSLTAYLKTEQHRYDAVIATLYSTVYWLPREATCRLGYYVQDCEPYFFATDDPEYTVALESYRQSEQIRMFTKTLWNQREVYRLAGRRPAVVGPSVDVSAFAPDAAGNDNDTIRIVAMVRPATPRRAPERTMRVLKQVASVLGRRVSVTIFGSSEADLERAGLQHSWATNVGMLDPAALSVLMSRSHIFLDCSDYQAMGLTALEAMLSGCAVIAPLRGGCNSFIRTGVNGLLVNTVDDAACVDAILKLVDDTALLAGLRRRAIEDANTYIPERAALQLMSVMFDD